MLTDGTRLGHYTIVGRVGAGGRGEVYRAEDGRDGRVVAIKVLPEQYAKDRMARGRFRREVAALAALSHPNILRIFEFEIDDEVAYAAMELLEGESLKQRVERGPILWTEAVRIGTEVADGLGEIHAKGILHRDLKPDNIFLTAEGAKILDFGLARLEMAIAEGDDGAPVKTGPGVMLGTVPYMSPEQILGLTLDSRADIFAFGCVLYEMITGKIVFARRTMVAAMSAILEDEPPALAEFGVPPDLEAILQRCAAKSAEARFQTAEEIATALREI